MSIENQLFTEKFRPQKLEQLIAPPRVIKQLEKGLIQNLLLYGSPGTGKTSSLFIIAKDHPYLYINASEERGIDTVREKIANFCSSMSLDGGKEKLKCVILDELDGATSEFFNAFKAFMEKFAVTTRFIASCNIIQKIPEPIQKSRFEKIPYDPINKEEEIYLLAEYQKRIAAILKAAGIAYTEDIIKIFIKNDFPDMRAIMNTIQSLYIRGEKSLTLENIATSSDFRDLFHLCLQPPTKPHDNYKFIINQYSSQIDAAFMAFGNDFPDYLKNIVPAKLDKLPGVLIEIADYQYKKSFVIDPLITLLALVFRLQQIINS